MIARMIGPDANYTTFDVADGQLPEHPTACDAYIITGSKSGVYDDLPWIAPLQEFLIDAKGRAKLVGICFGHQIMAQAFGGDVVRSEKGVGLGLHRYDLADVPDWADSAASISIAVSHQDQVIRHPPGARVIGGSQFTPSGILVYDNQDAISFQCHPEFEPAFSIALLEDGQSSIPADEFDALVSSLAAPNDRVRVAGWIRKFLGMDEAAPR